MINFSVLWFHTVSSPPPRYFLFLIPTPHPLLFSPSKWYTLSPWGICINNNNDKSIADTVSDVYTKGSFQVQKINAFLQDLDYLGLENLRNFLRMKNFSAENFCVRPSVFRLSLFRSHFLVAFSFPFFLMIFFLSRKTI